MSNDEGLFKLLAHLVAKQHSLEQQVNEKHHSLETRVEVLQVLNDRAEATLRAKNDEIAKLRQDISRLQRNQMGITSERDVARKELDMLRDTHNFTKRERDGFETQLKSTEEKRRKLRKSYNELGRVLPQDVKDEIEVAQLLNNVKGLLMN